MSSASKEHTLAHAQACLVLAAPEAKRALDSYARCQTDVKAHHKAKHRQWTTADGNFVHKLSRELEQALRLLLLLILWISAAIVHQGTHAVTRWCGCCAALDSAPGVQKELTVKHEARYRVLVPV